MKFGDVVWDDLTATWAIVLEVVPISKNKSVLHGNNYIILDSQWLEGMRYEWEVSTEFRVRYM